MGYSSSRPFVRPIWAVDEEIFAHDDTVKSVKATNSLDEEKDFDVTPLTQDILDKRAY